MDNQEQQLEALSDIRKMMERSTRFLSLSGLSGIIIGLIAILGAFAAFWLFDFNIHETAFYDNDHKIILEFYLFLIAFFTLIFSLASGYYFTFKRAKKVNEKIWTSAFKRMLINTFIPLVTGGIFCLILIYHNQIILVAPSTLVFYGLALLNGSKYTLPDIRYLGLCEIVLGLIASFYVGYGLIFWTIGFGFLHIFYGLIMYKKYDYETTNR